MLRNNYNQLVSILHPLAQYALECFISALNSESTKVLPSIPVVLWVRTNRSTGPHMEVVCGDQSDHIFLRHVGGGWVFGRNLWVNGVPDDAALPFTPHRVQLALNLSYDSATLQNVTNISGISGQWEIANWSDDHCGSTPLKSEDSEHCITVSSPKYLGDRKVTAGFEAILTATKKESSPPHHIVVRSEHPDP